MANAKYGVISWGGADIPLVGEQAPDTRESSQASLSWNHGVEKRHKLSCWVYRVQSLIDQPLHFAVGCLNMAGKLCQINSRWLFPNPTSVKQWPLHTLSKTQGGEGGRTHHSCSSSSPLMWLLIWSLGACCLPRQVYRHGSSVVCCLREEDMVWWCLALAVF